MNINDKIRLALAFFAPIYLGCGNDISYKQHKHEVDSLEKVIIQLKLDSQRLDLTQCYSDTIPKKQEPAAVDTLSYKPPKKKPKPLEKMGFDIPILNQAKKKDADSNVIYQIGIAAYCDPRRSLKTFELIDITGTVVYTHNFEPNTHKDTINVIQEFCGVGITGRLTDNKNQQHEYNILKGVEPGSYNPARELERKLLERHNQIQELTKEAGNIAVKIKEMKGK